MLIKNATNYIVLAQFQQKQYWIIWCWPEYPTACTWCAVMHNSTTAQGLI